MASASPKSKRGARPRAGKTIDGVEYVTTHSCPSCSAVMETIGPAYPQFVCAKCTVPLVSRSRAVGN